MYVLRKIVFLGDHAEVPPPKNSESLKHLRMKILEFHEFRPFVTFLVKNNFNLTTAFIQANRELSFSVIFWKLDNPLFSGLQFNLGRCFYKLQPDS